MSGRYPPWDDEYDDDPLVDDEEGYGPAFECAGFDDGSGWYCPLWGSEECDWDFPKGGLNPDDGKDRR